jgi:hypothetical protein
MNSPSYKKTYSFPYSFEDVVRITRTFSMEDKIRLEKELEKETLAYRAQKISEKIIPNKITIEDIVAEVSEYRKKKNAK